MQVRSVMGRWIAIGAAVALVSAAAVASPSNKWRLQFSGGANSDGSFVLKVTPTEGDVIEASVPIKKGLGENDVAQAVTKGLKAQLPKDLYKVERDDGEDVLLKRRSGKPKFDIEVVSFDVKGSRVSKQKE